MAPGLTQVKVPTNNTFGTAAQKMSSQPGRTTMYSSSRGNTQVGMLFGRNTTQRTFGQSFGITAQRSTTGFEKADYSFVRDLNASTPPLFKQDLYGGFDMGIHNCNHDNKMSTFEKVAMGMALLNAILPTVSDAVSTIKSTKGTSSAEDAGFNFDSAKFEMTKELSQATTFGKINNVEAKANEKLNNFQENYSKSGQDTITGINDLIGKTPGLQDADVSLDTSKLALSNLNINPDDLSSLDEAAKTINKDLAKVDEFITKDIKDGIDKCTTKSGELSQQIGTLESRKQAAQAAEATGGAPSPSSDEIQKQISELKEQKNKIDTARKELEGNITKAANDLKTELQKQQTTLGDIKEVKSELADKKYEVAKDNDKEISSNKKKMDKLNDEIKQLQTEAKNDPKKADKLKGKMDEFNGLVKEMSALKDSLKDMNDVTSFTNSKGKTHTMTNTSIDPKYFEVKTPSAGSGRDIKAGGAADETVGQQNSRVMTNLSDCKQAGDTIKIGKGSYVLSADGMFISDHGDKFSRDELQRIAYNDTSNPNQPIHGFNNFGLNA